MLRPPRRAASAQAHASGPRGFTLIELMVALTLFGTLVVLGLPSLMAWIHNTQMRSVAESLANGLRLAQTEAVRQNQAVAFALTNTAPPNASATAAANGKNWVIGSVTQFNTNGAFIQGGSLTNVASSVTITGPAAICFNANGRLMTTTTAGVFGETCTAGAQTYAFAQTSAATDDRQFRVLVSIAGQVRMCDKSLPNQSTTSPAGCPTGTP